MNLHSAPAPDEQCAELLHTAIDLASRAQSGEQVEAFVARSEYTSVRAHAGEIESFTSATSAGIGVRVVRDHRQGFAWAGSLDDEVVAGLGQLKPDTRVAFLDRRELEERKVGAEGQDAHARAVRSRRKGILLPGEACGFAGDVASDGGVLCDGFTADEAGGESEKEQ